jgi:plastocyanin
MSMMNVYFKDSITLSTRSSSSANGYVDITYTTSTIKGRFEDDLVLSRGLATVRTNEGEEIDAKARCFIPQGTSVTVGDKLTFDNQNYEVRHVGTMRAFGKKKFKELLLI